jgi:hypothetical protein
MAETLELRQAEMKARMRGETMAVKIARTRRRIEKPRRLPTSRASDVNDGWVYIVAIVGGGPTKIGITWDFDPMRRIQTIKYSLPFDIEIIGLKWMQRVGSFEAMLHHEFAQRRIRGEWFRLSSADHAYLRSQYGFLTKEEYKEENERKIRQLVMEKLS